MSNLYGTSKYVIKGDNAAKVYDAVVNSYSYNSFPGYLTLDYQGNLMIVVEEWDGYPHFGDYVLPFLVGDNFECLD